MTAIFNAIGALFEAILPLLPSFGFLMNYLFMGIGTIMIIGWINYMLKRKGEEQGFNIPESKKADYPLI